MGFETVKMRCTQPDRASISIQGQTYAVDASGYVEVLPIHVEAARSQDFVLPSEHAEIVAARRAQQSLLDKYAHSKMDDTSAPQNGAVAALTATVQTLIAQNQALMAKLEAATAASPAASKAPEVKR